MEQPNGKIWQVEVENVRKEQTEASLSLLMSLCSAINIVLTNIVDLHFQQTLNNINIH